MKNLKERILERLTINSYKAFVFEDIEDLASLHYLKTVLGSLKKEGIIKKITKEVFDFIDLDKSFGVTTSLATCEDVARALSRKYKWQLIPSSDFAMYLFKLDFFPNEYKYISNGPSCKYKIYNKKLIFEHIDQKIFDSYSYNTLLVLEVLKAIGTKNMNEKKLLTISSLITNEEKEALKNETVNQQNEYTEFINFICKN